MNIEKKIESIRSQPEHIRLRYVIGAVCISMLLVLIIWLAALKQSFYTIQDKSEMPTIDSTTPLSGFEQIELPSAPKTNTQQESAPPSRESQPLENVLQNTQQE